MCLYLKAFIQSLVQIGTVVSEKIQFEFLYVHDLGPRSRNDLDRQYSHIFIYSIRCLLLLTFRSLTAIVSEKSTVFTFSYRKNNEKFRSFKSRENIDKKEVGPYHGFGYLSLINDPINLAKGAKSQSYQI